MNWFELLRLANDRLQHSFCFPSFDCSMCPQRIFKCPICLENVSKVEAFVASKCSLRHEVCIDCMSSFISSSASSGSGTGIVCPCSTSPESNCKGDLTDDEIESLVPADVFQRFLKLREKRKHPNYRECPSCSKIVLGDPKAPKMFCDDCNIHFCFFHSNAHGYETEDSCTRYTNLTKHTEKSSKLHIKSYTKPCSRCKWPTEKNGGCNHITCANCKADWCWLCGRDYSSSHEYPSNLEGCPGECPSQLLPYDLWSSIVRIRFINLAIRFFQISFHNRSKSYASIVVHFLNFAVLYLMLSMLSVSIYILFDRDHYYAAESHHQF